jgi:hypothetical protein
VAPENFVKFCVDVVVLAKYTELHRVDFPEETPQGSGANRGKARKKFKTPHHELHVLGCR